MSRMVRLAPIPRAHPRGKHTVVRRSSRVFNLLSWLDCLGQGEPLAPGGVYLNASSYKVTSALNLFTPVFSQ